MDHWTLAGDAYVAVLSSANPIAGSARYPEKLLEAKNRQRLIDYFNKQSTLWTARNLDTEISQTRGQAVLIDSELNGAFLAADLNMDAATYKRLEARLNSSLKSTFAQHEASNEVLSAFKVESASIMLFLSGETSLAFNVSVANGWSDGALMRLLGPETRTDTTVHIMDILTELHASFQAMAIQFVSDATGFLPRDLSGKTVKPKAQIDPINSLNMIYAGIPTSSVTPVLPDAYRDLVYPNGVADVVSQTPFRDQFVFVGYAFGVVASDNPQERLKEVCLVPRLLHVAFNNLTAVADEVKVLRTSQQPMKVDTIASYYARLQSEISAVLSPTMTFRHEMLLLRDAIISEWFVGRSINEAETVLKGLLEDARRRHEERERRRGWVLNIILAVLALVSTIGVFADLKELAWWPFNLG
ncbi:hypothetical protein [Hyphococcus sp.]|uniref:hypothetical protein n=1 Tax=Hyphococcus sp. TaxID=2038636 RepID=UPI00208783BA|nr:MAG: hypothetical protein DHS20C04_17980 [Marinicaulis sp.]